MSVWQRLGRYVGGTLSLAGFGFATAFVGRRTADPVAAQFVQPFTVWTQIGGIVAGLAIIGIGLALASLTNRLTAAK